jgi:hypothetical protein
MAVTFNPFTGNLDFVGSGGGSTSPGGSDTQIQFNDDGDFGGDAGLVFNKSTNKLTAGGDIELNDGGANTLTLQTVTPTAARTISFPDATGTVGLVAGSTTDGNYHSLWGGFLGAVPFVQDGALTVSNGLGYDEVNGILSVRGGFTTGGASTVLGATTTGALTSAAGTFSGRVICSVANAASAPAGSFTGTWFTTGTSTTTKPALLVEQSTAISTGWSTAGTGFGVNSTSAFTGRLVDWQFNGTSRWHVTAGGLVVGTQGAPAAVNATATLTIADIQAGLITSTTAAAVDMTLPTGTDMDGGFTAGTFTDMAIMWSVINTGSNAATLLAGADHTIVGAAAVAAGTSGRFTSRRTAATTWVSYRVS